MPLSVLVTRSTQQASELAENLRAYDLEPILIPAIETVEPTSWTTLNDALKSFAGQGQEKFHWLIFTSANAVNVFGQRFGMMSTENISRTLQDVSIAAIGPATARALQQIGLKPALVPSQAVAESLTEALLPHALQQDGSPTRFLLVRAEEGREHLPESLRAAGSEVTIAPAYRTIIPAGSIEAIRQLFQPQNRVAHPLKVSSSKRGVPSSDQPQTPIDAITFTSSSTARNLLALCEAAAVMLPESALRISIGPVTSQTLRDLGYPPHAEAPEATVASLAETVVKTLNASFTP